MPAGPDAFRPTAFLLALDAYHLAGGIAAGLRRRRGGGRAGGRRRAHRATAGAWRARRSAARSSSRLPCRVHADLLGSNEHRLAGSRAAFLARLNRRGCARWRSREQVDMLALDARAAARRAGGLARLRRCGTAPNRRSRRRRRRCTAIWSARWLAAQQGRSSKCLVLDLDNTLWGGVIGDDGLEGIVLGQGSAARRGLRRAFQDYARELARRGVILAVCSKNDEANALEPFERHPDMVLRRGDIACFVANWSDKAGNIRAIARS